MEVAELYWQSAEGWKLSWDILDQVILTSGVTSRASPLSQFPHFPLRLEWYLEPDYFGAVTQNKTWNWISVFRGKNFFHLLNAQMKLHFPRPGIPGTLGKSTLDAGAISALKCGYQGSLIIDLVGAYREENFKNWMFILRDQNSSHFYYKKVCCWVTRPEVFISLIPKAPTQNWMRKFTCWTTSGFGAEFFFFFFFNHYLPCNLAWFLQCGWEETTWRHSSWAWMEHCKQYLRLCGQIDAEMSRSSEIFWDAGDGPNSAWSTRAVRNKKQVGCIHLGSVIRADFMQTNASCALCS